MGSYRILSQINYLLFQQKFNLAQYKGYILFNLNGGLYKFNLSTKELKVIVPKNVRTFAVANDHIYISKLNEEYNIRSLDVIDIEGNFIKSILEDLKYVDGLKSIHEDLYIFDDYVERLYRYNSVKEDLIEMPTNCRYPNTVLLENEHIIFSNEVSDYNTGDDNHRTSRSRILKVSKDREGYTEEEQLFTCDGDRIVELESDHEYIYFVKVENSFETYYCNKESVTRLYSLNKKSGEVKKLSEDIICDIIIQGSWIYFINKSKGNALYRIDRTGEHKEVVDENFSVSLEKIGEYIYYFNMNSSDFFRKCAGIVRKRLETGDKSLSIITKNERRNEIYFSGVSEERRKLNDLKSTEVEYVLKRLSVNTSSIEELSIIRLIENM